MRRHLQRAYYVSAYYISWLMFGSVGLLLNLVCLPLLLLPKSWKRRVCTRPLIRWLFTSYVKWFHACGGMRLTWIGFDKPLPPGTVYVANHPCLLDAPILLSRIPDAICIFKPRLIRNPAVGPMAILAEYVAGEDGVDTIRIAAARVAAGRSIIVFPEGTRTATGTVLGPLRSGFALLAARARAPVQAIIIRSAPDFLRRGRPWWIPPRELPTHFTVELGRSWENDPARHANTLAREVADYFEEALGGAGRKDAARQLQPS